MIKKTQAERVLLALQFGNAKAAAHFLDADDAPLYVRQARAEGVHLEHIRCVLNALSERLDVWEREQRALIVEARLLAD